MITKFTPGTILADYGPDIILKRSCLVSNSKSILKDRCITPPTGHIIYLFFKIMVLILAIAPHQIGGLRSAYGSFKMLITQQLNTLL